MKRIDVIDGLRGYFLVFMLINHLVFDGGYWLVFLNHRQIAFVEDAQGFVFLSGLVIGMVYARKMQRGTFMSGAGAIWRRARELYLYAMGILAVVLTASALIPTARTAWHDWLWDLGWDTPRVVASAALLVFQPTYMDILPQYILYMLPAPFLIRWVLKGRWDFVLIGSVLLWMAAQFGVYRPFTDALDAALRKATGVELRVYFNLLGWQFLFVPAMVFGVMTTTGQMDWTRVFRPDRSFIAWAGLLVCLFFLPFKLAMFVGWMPGSVWESFHVFENRANFGLVYLLNFAGAAAGLAWLLIAGPDHRSALVRRIAGALTALFRFSFLRLLGRHSLYVYVWHVAIVYAVRLAGFNLPPLGEATKIVVAFLAIGLLAVPAVWRERPGGKAAARGVGHPAHGYGHGRGRCVRALIRHDRIVDAGLLVLDHGGRGNDDCKERARPRWAESTGPERQRSRSATAST